MNYFTAGLPEVLSPRYKMNSGMEEEAWTMYMTSIQYLIRPFNNSDLPITLCSFKSFKRITKRIAILKIAVFCYVGTFDWL